MADNDELRPARGYSWEPFRPGHTLSVRHGADSPRLVEQRAEQIHAHLDQAAPWLNEPSFAPALRRYLAAAAREEMLHDHIESVVAKKGVGAVAARVWEQATAAARLAAKLGQDLGLDPIGAARLRAVSVSGELASATLEDIAARGREAIAAAEAREAAARAAQPPELPAAGDDSTDTPADHTEPHSGPETGDER